MTRLLDRYVWSTFLAALAVFLFAFLALYVVVDLATKLDRFLELENVSVLGLILRFYLVRVPVFANYMLPSVVLFASIFTLIRLSRNNEILPMVASGTSLRRVALPFLATAVASSAAMGAMDEWALPRLAEEIADTEAIVQGGEKSFEVWMYGERAENGEAKERILVLAKIYDPVAREMHHVKVERMDGRGTHQVALAAACRWDEAREAWVAHDGHVEFPLDPPVPGPRGGRPQTRQEALPASGWVVPGPFTPKDVRESSSFMNRIPFATLDDLLREARVYPHIPIFRVKIHLRFAFPLSPVVLLLLGLPFAGGLVSAGFLRGLFFCFLLALAYYVCYFAFVELGIKGRIAPILAGWLPTAAFGAIGLAAFARIRT